MACSKEVTPPRAHAPEAGSARRGKPEARDHCAARGEAPSPATTVTKAVVSGDSVWSLAQNVKTDRPLEQVVADIERMNDVQGALQPGQRVVVPVR